MTGYAHPKYAESLAEFGTPRLLPKSGGWILERPIPYSSDRDAMGCYPLFACQDWSQLHADLEEIGNDLVSLSVVPDSFGEYSPAYLRDCFKDVVIHFKDHFITDLRAPLNTIISKHHRYYARKALEKLRVEKCSDPPLLLDDWSSLYAGLAERHGLKGMKAFSRKAFTGQLSVPGLVMFRAVFDDTTVGAHLWYVQGEVAYSHLAASSPLGYEMMAAYALYWFAIEYFAEQVRWLNLGAGAGVQTDGGTDGLSRFKQGWATGSRKAYYCGRVFDQDKYSNLVLARGVPATDYFPTYRKGEFA